MENLRLVTWNVLADAYLLAERYPCSPPGLLEAGARTELIVEHAAALHADVLCLQEAEAHLVAALEARLDGTATVWWCPKGNGRPDGCAAVVADPLAVRSHRRVEFPDDSGHVAQLLEVRTPGGGTLTVANTHLRWAPELSSATHVGAAQAAHLVSLLAGCDQAVVCGDVNAGAGPGPRGVLAGAGFRDLHAGSISARVNTVGLRALDTISVRGLRGTASAPPSVPDPAPSAALPSDHVPLGATVRM